MRRNLAFICGSIPALLLAIACSSSDDSSSNDNAGGAGTAGTSSKGGAGSGGASSNTGGATTNGGTSSAHAGSGDSANGGEPSTNGGSAGAAGATNETAGAAGSDGTEPNTPANAVYTMTNASAGNQILGFTRANEGSLTPMAAPFPTGGKGSGASLGEQGAVAYDRVKNRLYAVNAGDNSFSVFPVKLDGSLGTALQVMTTGFGATAASLIGPKSITFSGDVVYVLYEGNATTPSMIAGFTLQGDNTNLAATAIASSALPLSDLTQSVDPAQISFTPDGKWLIVSEKQSGANGAVTGDGSLDSFAVDATGLATKKGFYPTAPAAAGGAQKTPFGFDFAGSTLVVSEAGSTGTGSYTYANGVIAPVASATAQFLPTDPAPCWVAVTANWAYVANAQGPNVSGFTVAADGSLSNIGPIKNAVVASTGKTIVNGTTITNQGPTDEFISIDGKYLYVLNSAVPSIGIFAVADNGTLARVGATDYTPTAAFALSAGVAGIVAR